MWPPLARSIGQTKQNPAGRKILRPGSHVPGLLATCFTWLASRPAQMTTGQSGLYAVGVFASNRTSSAQTTRRRTSNCRSTFASELRVPLAHQREGARRRERDRKDGDPDHARAVAIMRVRYDAAERRIAEERQHQCRGEASEIGEFGAVDAKQQ